MASGRGHPRTRRLHGAGHARRRQPDYVALRPVLEAAGCARTNSAGASVASFTPPFPAYPSGHATFGATAFHAARLYLQSIGMATIQPDGSDDLAFQFVSGEVDGRSFDPDLNVRPRHVRSFAQRLGRPCRRLESWRPSGRTSWRSVPVRSTSPRSGRWVRRRCVRSGRGCCRSWVIPLSCLVFVSCLVFASGSSGVLARSRPSARIGRPRCGDTDRPNSRLRRGGPR